MSCQCLLHSEANRLNIYIYPVFFGFPSHFGHHRALMSSLSEHLFLAQLHESFIALCFSQLELDSSPSGELCWKTTAGSHPWLVKSGSWRCSHPLYISAGYKLASVAHSPENSPLQTLAGRVIMVADVLTIWNGYSCRDPSWLPVLRNSFTNGSSNQEGWSRCLALGRKQMPARWKGRAVDLLLPIWK